MVKVQVRANKWNEEMKRNEPGDIIKESDAKITRKGNITTLSICEGQEILLEAGEKVWLTFPEKYSRKHLLGNSIIPEESVIADKFIAKSMRRITNS